MATTTFSPALRAVTRAHPAFNRSELWMDALRDAGRMPDFRSGTDETAGSVIAALRSRLAGEIVAFHKLLIVTPQPSTTPSMRRWQIAIPLTLFPKRDQGFTRVECAVEFAAPQGGTFRVIDAVPVDRAETVAEAGMGAELQVEASGKAGVPIPLGVGDRTVASASAKVYGHAKSDFKYSVRRAVVTSEVTRGTGAAWRLENPSDRERLAAESHQLAAIVETEGDVRLDAAGYVKAYSEVQWLTSALGDLLANLSAAFRKFIASGAPAEAFGEWSDLLPHA
jgi:hypothetical protein